MNPPDAEGFRDLDPDDPEDVARLDAALGVAPLPDKDRLICVVRRAVIADEHALLLVANNNGSASQAAWDRIVAHPAYQALEANLAESRAVLASLYA